MITQVPNNIVQSNIYKPYSNEIHTGLAIAADSAKAIMDIYARPFEVHQKENNEGPVTEADLAANEIIICGLKKNFPNDQILSEESPDSTDRLNSNRVWCIDPLDGTKDFLKKNDEFAVQIGLIENGKAKLGILALPAKNTYYIGLVGLGSFEISENGWSQLQVSGQKNLPDSIVTCSRHHQSTHLQKCIDYLGVTNKVYHGSVGCKVALIAKKEADFFFYLQPHTKEWDTCAPQVILEEAGGKMSDIQGQSLGYNKENPKNLTGVLATNEILHSEISHLLTKFVDQS